MAIVTENIEAMQAVYFAWTLEAMRLFDVVERIVELWRRGALPLGTGATTSALQRYVSDAPARLTARERRDFYAAAFGAPGGSPDIEPNRDFNALWMRFLASVAVHERNDPACVRKAARALAINVSDHGAGLTPAARRLAADVDANFAIVLEPEIAKAFGARDMWQVVEQVSARELGGAVDTIRYRTLAQAGGAVLRWLAAKAETLDRTANDFDLLHAVEEWIAVTGIQDNAVEQYAQPTESPTIPATNLDLPGLILDLLDAVGVSAGGGPPRGVVLLCGPGGTAKSLAGFLIAEALRIDVLRIDLARVVSRWIGETERNVDAIFAQATASGAMLLFDEADSLFGQRTEVADAHGRYANIDVEFLLQSIEEHDGFVFVATNPHSDLDRTLCDAHWRHRLHAVISFPRPWR